jgi:hypothetical protein
MIQKNSIFILFLKILKKVIGKKSLFFHLFNLKLNYKLKIRKNNKYIVKNNNNIGRYCPLFSLKTL